MSFAIIAETNPRELSQADPEKQSRAQKARKPLMEKSMQRAADGSLPLVGHAVPHARPARPRPACRWPASRTSTTPPASPTDADPVTAWRASPSR